MPSQDSRAGQLNAVIDPKLLFLAKIGARYKGQTLAEFIEHALTLALDPEEMLKDELPAKRLFHESLWKEDDAARLFAVATADLMLLSPKQRNLYHHATDEMIRQGRKINIKSFTEFLSGGE